MAEVRLRAVLFDWDGTLLDSAEACRRSYERLFGSFGIAFDRALFDASYSPDWYRTYEKVGLPREKWSEADAAWLAIYASEECGLVAGAREALALLAPESLSSGLVTSGTAERVRREISRLGLAFDAVVCTEEVGRRKPDPAALHLGLERLGVAPREAAYVGDSPEDIEMARAAGVYSVAIPGAFPNREQLRAAGPDLFSEDLLNAVRALLGA
ncbi:MAG TPA: HAD family hydrolase [Thermoanaerobaculia bacterium]|nr:HAD family hydrolase [Thermoanaerobaculia bacterium]